MPVSSIVRLEPVNLAQLEELLRQNNLPTQDCAEQALNFYGIFDGDELIAAGGLEPAADYVLLRSVVVKEHYRAFGLARKISQYLIDLAEAETEPWKPGQQPPAHPFQQRPGSRQKYQPTPCMLARE